MPNRKYIVIACWIFLLALCQGTAMADEEASAQGQQLKVFVPILPTEYFVRRIGGDRVQVQTLVQPGHSPETYAPSPKQMAQLASARIYFRIGLPFENSLVPRLARTFPQITVIDLQQGIELQKIAEHHDDEDHGHEEGEIDPHTWLDPLLALAQSKIIRDSLIKADSEMAEGYSENFRKLAADLKELDMFLGETLAPFKHSTVYVFHPAYGYFCRAYDLVQKPITPGGKEPGAQYIARLIEDAKKDRVRVIFVQPQFSDKSARTIANAIGGSVLHLDPLAYEYITNLKFMARQIAESLPEPRQQ